MAALTFNVGNTMILELEELTNSVTGLADTGATVTATLYDSGGDEVATDSNGWPVTLSHVSAGTYRATLPHDIGVTAGKIYYAYVDVIGTGGAVGHWEDVVRVYTRT